MNAVPVMMKEKLRFLVEIKRQDMKRASIVLVSTIALAFGFSKYFGVFLDLTELRCMPEYVYLGFPLYRDIHKGDVISFIPHEDEMMGVFTGKRVAKLVVAMEGDYVLSDETGVFVNGKFVADRSPVSVSKMKDRNLTPMNINKTLKKGEMFVMGVLPRSFDSRYWGPMQKSHADRFIKPLF